MREILFRGKRLDNGEWTEGYLLEQNTPSYNAYVVPHIMIEQDNRHTDILEHEIEEVDPATVGQYTGLTDKNGKKIFEGDIVEGGDFDAEEGYGVIRWEDGAFEVATETFLGTFHENYWGKDFEIIGNIHDNPELLEVGE